MTAINQKEIGLYEKFTVKRNDGLDAPGKKHHGDQYFVLNVTTDQHAIKALRAYADSCQANYPVLASDLRKIARPVDCLITVPDVTLPNGTLVESFRVGKYLSSRDHEGNVAINSIDTPWVEVNYHEAVETAEAAGMSLITEIQWLAIAYEITQQDINWTGGRVGEGSIYQGLHKNSVSCAQPGAYESSNPEERRWHQLSNGERIWDFAGNVYSWVFDNVQGDDQGLSGNISVDSPSLTTAPYPSMKNGMGLFPDSSRDWSGSALVRGGYWYSYGNAGVFGLDGGWPGGRYDYVGFRCTTK